MSWMETPEARASNDDERRNLIAGARHSQSVSHLPRAFARVIQYPLHPRPFSPEYRRGEGRNVNLIVSWEEPLGTEALVSRRVSNQPARSQRWPICWQCRYLWLIFLRFAGQHTSESENRDSVQSTPCWSRSRCSRVYVTA